MSKSFHSGSGQRTEFFQDPYQFRPSRATNLFFFVEVKCNSLWALVVVNYKQGIETGFNAAKKDRDDDRRIALPNN
jgi:hypothetical protein